MTLYERLSEEHKEKVRKNNLKFPATTELLMEDLNNKSYSTDMKIVNASALFTILFKLQPFNLLTFYQLFEN